MLEVLVVQVVVVAVLSVTAIPAEVAVPPVMANPDTAVEAPPEAVVVAVSPNAGERSCN